jgi:hypothetical protein
VIFAGPGPAGDGTDVLLHNSLTGETRTIAGGPGPQDSPDVSFTTAVYRTAAGVALESWLTGALLRDPDGDATAANPAIGQEVAAWETGAPGSRDVVVNRYLLRREYALVLPGDQHAPAAHGSVVAYVDGGRGGEVWRHDAVAGASARVAPGHARSVSVGSIGTDVFLAVERSASASDPDVDVEVYDALGNRLAALPAAGVQRNPHLSGEWVAFEDVSTGVSQVVLWRWTTPYPPGLVFVPRPSGTDQRLNDVSFVAPGQVRVVFEDSASPDTGRDIALYALDLLPEIVLDDEPNGWPIEPPPPPPGRARCDDPEAIVLATLEVRRGRRAPAVEAERFDVPGAAGAGEAPVLVCLDAERVSSAWVTLDGRTIATPCDFEPHVVHLEARATVGREACLAAVVAGAPGSKLTVRVLADPPVPPAAEPEPGAAPGPEPEAERRGCGAGAAGAPSILALLLAAALRRLRRA